MKTATVLVTLSALACIYGVYHVEAACNTLSTAKIIQKLCYNGDTDKNQTLIDAFFACYDHAPGKAQFVKCQTDLFGGPMDNVKVVSYSCDSPLKIPSYGLCIKREMDKAGIDMNSAVATLNACQSKVLGINTRSLCN